MNAGVAQICSLKELTSLNLYSCSQISDAGLLLDLRHLSALTGLVLTHYTKIIDAGMAELRLVLALTDLNLANCKEMTDAGMAKLRHLTALRELSLAGCSRMSDAGVAHICLLWRPATSCTSAWLA